MLAHQLRGQTAERCSRADLLRQFDRRVEILEQSAHMPFNRLELTLGHLRRENLQRFGIGKTAGQRRCNQAGINPSLLGQGHYFGDHQRITGNDHLVAHFGYLARTDIAHARQALPQVRENRPNAFNVLNPPSGHDCQRAIGRTRRAARHGRIDPVHAATGVQLSCHLTGGGRFQTREVHQHLSWLGHFRNAARAKHHLAHHLSIGQAKHDDIGPSTELRRAGHHLRPQRLQWRALIRGTVPHAQRITSGQQALGHRQAHQANTSKCQSRKGGGHRQTPTH